MAVMIGASNCCWSNKGFTDFPLSQITSTSPSSTIWHEQNRATSGLDKYCHINHTYSHNMMWEKTYSTVDKLEYFSCDSCVVTYMAYFLRHETLHTVMSVNIYGRLFRWDFPAHHQSPSWPWKKNYLVIKSNLVIKCYFVTKSKFI